MAIGAGLCSQLGLAEESTVGTAVTVTRFYEFDSLEPTHEKMTKVSEGLRACGRGHRERNRVVVGKSVSLQTTMTAMTKGLGVFFKHALGSTTTAQIAASATHRQIHLVGDLTGKGLTVQGGFPQSYDGTVRPYTWNGAKITEWQLSCAMDDLLKLELSLDAWNWTNGTALATASYLTGLEAWHWGQLTATFGGTPSTGSGRTTIASGTTIKGLRGVTLAGKNTLRTDRRLGGGAGIKAEQVESGWREYTGELDMEFADRTQLVDLFDSDASTALQFTWTGTTNDGSGNFPVLRVTYPKVKFDTGAPSVGGPDLLDSNITFTAYEEDAGTHPLIQVELETQDTTP